MPSNEEFLFHLVLKFFEIFIQFSFFTFFHRSENLFRFLSVSEAVTKMQIKQSTIKQTFEKQGISVYIYTLMCVYIYLQFNFLTSFSELATEREKGVDIPLLFWKCVTIFKLLCKFVLNSGNLFLPFKKIIKREKSYFKKLI